MKSGTNNLFLFHVLVPLQLILAAAYFRSLLNDANYKNKITVIAVFYLAFAAICTIYFQGPFQYNSYASVAKAAVVVVFSAIYFIQFFRFKNEELIDLKATSDFWIITGLLCYSLSTFFFEGVMNQLINAGSSYGLTFYFINVIIGYIMYLLIFTGWLINDYPIQLKRKNNE